MDEWGAVKAYQSLRSTQRTINLNCRRSKEFDADAPCTDEASRPRFSHIHERRLKDPDALKRLRLLGSVTDKSERFIEFFGQFKGGSVPQHDFTGSVVLHHVQAVAPPKKVMTLAADHLALRLPPILGVGMDPRGVQQLVEEGADHSAQCPLQERSHSMLHTSLLLVVRDKRADDPNRAGKRLR